MAGDFWSGVGDWWGGITGGTQQEAGQAGQAAAQQAAGQQASYQTEKGKGYDVGAQESMGANATEMMQKANEASQAQAEQAGKAAATQGTRQAVQAGRTSGLNRGQAALAGGQQAGDIYSKTYQGGLESGRNQYNQNAQAFANQGNTSAQLAQGATGQQGAMGLAQQQMGQQQGQNFWGGVAGLAGSAAGLLSDIRAKKNVQGSSNLDAIIAKVKPVNFDYKGENGEQRPGVIAQELEGTPLESTVQDTPAGKVIDTNQLSGANLNLIIELASRVKELEGKVGQNA